MRFVLVPLLLVPACSSSSVSPDLGAPVDMHIATPTMLASTSTLTNCIASDGSFVYWSDSTPAINRVPVAGGAVQQLYAGGDKSACVAVDGSGVYFFDADKLMKAALAGGGAMALATGQHILKAPLVAAGGFVYWATDVYGDVDAFNGKYAIVRAPTGGGAVSTVAATLTGTPGGLAVDDTNVYYSDPSGMYAFPIATPTMTTSFGMSSLHGNAFAVGGTHLAMTEIMGIGMGDIAVFRLDGSGRVVVSPMLGTPLAVDDRGVYVNGGGSLERLALDGSGATLLATTGPRAVAVVGSTIYFTDGAGIYSLPK